jgi:hypothetical protein
MWARKLGQGICLFLRASLVLVPEYWEVVKRDRSNIRRPMRFSVLLLHHCGLLCYCPRQAGAFPASQGRRSRVLPLRFQGMVKRDKEGQVKYSKADAF